MLNKSKADTNREARRERAKVVAKRIDNLIGLRGQRVLEVGCDRGDLSVCIAQEYKAEVVGLDVREIPEWSSIQDPNVKLMKYDLTTKKGQFADGEFTRIISRAVWEHIFHPYSALEECQRILSIDGKKYMFVNFYRSAIGSHLYHTIDIPWPHLLYSANEIISKFKIKLPHSFWCNKLTYGQYLLYFKQLGFRISYEMLHKRELDEEFYNNHINLLGLYPKFDLVTDFGEFVLEFEPARPKTEIPDPVFCENAERTIYTVKNRKK